DDGNYCAVEAAELYDNEVILFIQVVGDLFDAALSEIFSISPAATTPWRANGVRAESLPATGFWKVTLSFPAPANVKDCPLLHGALVERLVFQR
ncbi:unnamed protein product, partial [Durusdinium trenchii]